MTTKIEWTDETWNPVTGCTKVSAGCKNCYAEKVADRFWKGRKFTDVQTHADRLDAPLRWRKPRRVFVNSMSDLFHEAVHRDFVLRVFLTMAAAPKHTFQVLTKRPRRMRDLLAYWLPSAMQLADGPRLRAPDWPLPNVWLGVSVENQETADERIPLLLQTPAAVRFLSCEPLLGPIDLHLADAGDDGEVCGECLADGKLAGLDWVIVGGESGPGARPCDVAWIRSIVQQCGAAQQAACFVKQLGAKPVARDRWDMSEQVFRDADAGGWTEADGAMVMRLRDRKGGDPSEWPEDLRVREFPA